MVKYCTQDAALLLQQTTWPPGYMYILYSMFQCVDCRSKRLHDYFGCWIFFKTSTLALIIFSWFPPPQQKSQSNLGSWVSYIFPSLFSSLNHFGSIIGLHCMYPLKLAYSALSFGTQVPRKDRFCFFLVHHPSSVHM